MIRILIVDDELSAGNLLKVLIEKHIPGEKQTEVCTHPAVALTLLPTYQPTLIMLDIEMPGMNGFDFLNQASAWDFDVIFTTAYDKYAIKAIRFSALDYLLKPVDKVELQNAVNRHIAKRQANIHGIQQPLLKNLIYNLNQQDQQQFKLAVPGSDGIFMFRVQDIIMLEGKSNYTKLFFTGHKPLVVAKTLKEYEEILNDHGFIRVHKSFLVNKQHVTKIEHEGMLCLTGDLKVPVSRRKKHGVIDKFSGES